MTSSDRGEMMSNRSSVWPARQAPSMKNARWSMVVMGWPLHSLTGQAARTVLNRTQLESI